MGIISKESRTTFQHVCLQSLQVGFFIKENIQKHKMAFDSHAPARSLVAFASLVVDTQNWHVSVGRSNRYGIPG
jgi:hypothetical protein